MTKIENQKHFAVGELRDSELAHVSGGTSGLIYAVIAGAQNGVLESRLEEYKAVSANPGIKVCQ